MLEPRRLVSVILAAGKGTRMRSDLPKVLHPLLGAPLLEYVLESVEALSPSQVVVVVGYQKDQIMHAFGERSILWAVQEEQLGTGHAANCGVAAAGGREDTDFLVVNGDLPLLRAETLEGLLECHRGEEQGKPAGVTILTCKKSDPTGYGRIARDKEGRVRAIVEEKDADPIARKNQEVNVGTYVFRSSVFQKYYREIDRTNVQGELYLTDVVVKAAQGGEVVSTFSVKDEEEVAQVNSRSEMAGVASVLKERILSEHMDGGVTFDDPQTAFIEKGVKIGRDTRILPFTVIHRGVEIGERCEIGPFTHLRPGTRVGNGASICNFVEVKNSTLGAGTKAKHLSYIGDATLGEGVNIGAGTIFANYDGKVKSKTVVKDKAFLGSGTVLVAPVTIGKGAITGAGSVVLKNRNVPDGGVVVGVPAKPLEKQPLEKQMEKQPEKQPGKQ